MREWFVYIGIVNCVVMEKLRLEAGLGWRYSDSRGQMASGVSILCCDQGDTTDKEHDRYSMSGGLAENLIRQLLVGGVVVGPD